MRAWLIRGLIMAVLWGIVQTVHAKLSVYDGGSVVSAVVSLAILAVAAMIWAAVDTWYEHPDRGVLWLKSGLVAGVVGALLGVIGQASFVDQTGTWALGPALTGGAAFIALGVLVPAGIGLLVGTFVTPRREITPSPRPRSKVRPHSKIQPRKRDRSAPLG
jgi:hypothetical protein